MMQSYKCITLWCTLVLTLLPAYCHATILVTGNGTAGVNTFTFPISAKVYDPATGSLYVGLATNVTPYTISRADRPLGREKPKFEGIAPDSVSRGIKDLALVTFTGNNIRSPLIGGPLVAYTLETPAQEAIVSAVKYDKSKSGSSEALKDAAGTDASATKGLAANCSYIFTGVAPSGGIFGAENSGIAVVCVKENETTTLVLHQTAAEPGDSAIKAKRLDHMTPQLYINAVTPPTIDDEAAYLHWSDYLKRLYIGLDITATAGGKSVIVGRVCNGALIFSDIAVNSAIEPLGNVVATSADATITTTFLKTMHATTGPSYLIVYGGDVTHVTDALSRISALPLVDNPNDIEHHGTLAKFDSDLVNYKFVVPAANAGDLAEYNEDAVMVGAGPLPISTPTQIHDMEVIGDTVYVAIDVVQSSSNDNGVFYSQAQFDDEGKISHWTPWTKRAFPYRGFCDTTDCITQSQSFCEPPAECNSCCQNKGVAFVAVDAVTGKVWAVDGFSKQIVRLTAWDRGSCISQLPCQLNRALPCGSYSVLDPDQSTLGFQEGFVAGDDRNTTEHRYALFGGCNKVVFTRVSEAIPVDNFITLTSPQKIMIDFCPTEIIDCCNTSTGITNFRITSVAPNAGCVYHLEYSRTGSDAGSTNYFFAGTNTGLYVFANPDGSGFNVTDLTTLDQPPFSTGVWFPTSINDSIVDMKALGENLYVITRSLDEGNIVSKLYQIPFATDIHIMFDTLPNPIATSGEGQFTNVLLFTGLQPISFEATNQLLMSTNHGLYLVDSLEIPPATFTQVPANVTTMFAGIGGIDTPFQTTVWPFSVEAGSCRSFSASSIYQISGPNPTAFIPEFFNASCFVCPFKQLYPITYFWSDGARRFFIINRPCDWPMQNRLMIFPFAVEIWNVNIPIDQTLVYDSFIDGVQRFNWIRHIGATGILMAGVNNGVIALE